jgi:hypothetical protein
MWLPQLTTAHQIGSISLDIIPRLTGEEFCQSICRRTSFFLRDEDEGL